MVVEGYEILKKMRNWWVYESYLLYQDVKIIVGIEHY